MPESQAPTQTTRERLMTAAVRLVAEHGYEAASVGAIERAAGLAPRSGALYKHFKGKDDLLRAAIEREVRAVDELDAVVEMLPLGDLRAELTLLARWNLASLARRSELTRLVQREAHRLPPELLEQLYEHLVDRPRDQCRVRPDRGPLVGVPQQGDEPVGDEGPGGLVPAEHEQRALRGDLGLGDVVGADGEAGIGRMGVGACRRCRL